MGETGTDKVASNSEVLKGIPDFFSKQSSSEMLTDEREETDKMVKEVQDYAKELSLSLKEEVGLLHSDNCNLKERILTLEAANQHSNLKCRGFTKHLDTNVDLPVFIANWPAQELSFEENVILHITEAYQLGPISHPYQSSHTRPKNP
ncbi:UNVERIFIED_CONTAM: hypothetical protein K2H54_062136 [Gekko kuhli]